MKFLTTSVVALALVLGVSAAASACEWNKQAMAKATPAETAKPATPVDPVVLANLAESKSDQSATAVETVIPETK